MKTNDKFPISFPLSVIPSLPGHSARGDGEIFRGERQLAQHVHETPRGAYKRVQVYVDGKRVWRRVNRLVCEAWNGEPKKGHHARHKNGDSMDNRASNLEWGSAKANYLDQVAHGTANKEPLPPKKRAMVKAAVAERGISDHAARALIRKREQEGFTGPLLWQDFDKLAEIGLDKCSPEIRRAAKKALLSGLLRGRTRVNLRGEAMRCLLR